MFKRLLRRLGPLGRFLYCKFADPPIEDLLEFLDLPKDRVLKIPLSMGTFNPIHLWHLQVAQCSWAGGLRDVAGMKLLLDFVIFIVGQPPHKDDVAPKGLRYAMVKAAIKGNPRFYHSRVELDREGKSYTVDTLRQLHQIFESRGYKVEFYLLMGMDNVEGLKKWKEAPEIMAPGLCKLVIAPRYQALMTAEMIQEHLPERKENVDWFLLESPDSDVSSTQIRKWIATGQPACADYLVPNAVRKIIGKYACIGSHLPPDGGAACRRAPSLALSRQSITDF